MIYGFHGIQIKYSQITTSHSSTVFLYFSLPYLYLRGNSRRKTINVIYGFHGILTPDGVCMGNTLEEHQPLDGARARSLGVDILVICTW